MNGRKNVVVVGVDGSPSSDLALLWAADDAQRRGAALQLVQAYGVPAGFTRFGAMIPPSLLEDARTGAEASLARARSAVLTEYPDLETIAGARADTPFAALQHASEHALLTVVGSHGTGVVSETVLGSVALKMASHNAARWSSCGPTRTTDPPPGCRLTHR